MRHRLSVSAMRCERGQATIEWAGVVLVATLALGALVALAPQPDGRSLGALLAHSIACSARGSCEDTGRALSAAYGERDAELVRAHAPGLVYEPRTHSLPVDFRDCRRPSCSDASDDRKADLHSSAAGVPATAFSRVIHRGGEIFIQYWHYYPDSSTTSPGSLSLRMLDHVLPVHHRDDWESYQVRIDRVGRVSARASSHRAYQGCKLRRCRNRWIAATGWTRVSRGSHAGHIPIRSRPGWDRPLYPGPRLDERTTSAPGVRLVPLETLDKDSYRPLDGGISPPWKKRVYVDPLSDSTA